MKTANEISKDIINTTIGIEQDFPELLKYINEMPVSIPNVSQPEITVENLKDYSDSLNEMVTKYSKNKKL